MKLPPGILTGKMHRSSVNIPWLKRRLVTSISREVRVDGKCAVINYKVSVELENMYTDHRVPRDYHNTEIFGGRVDEAQLSEMFEAVEQLSNALAGVIEPNSGLEEMRSEIERLRAI